MHISRVTIILISPLKMTLFADRIEVPQILDVQQENRTGVLGSHLNLQVEDKILLRFSITSLLYYIYAIMGVMEIFHLQSNRIPS